MAGRHLIERQVLDLRFGDPSSAAGSEREVRDAFFNVGVPALQGVLDDIAPDDEVVRLNKVVIDLGHLGSGSLDTELRDSLSRFALEQLTSLIEARRASGPDEAACKPSRGGGDHTLDRLENPRSDVSRAAACDADDDELSFGGVSEVVQFAERFLAHGDAPWWSAVRYRGDPESAARIGSLICDAYVSTPSFRRTMLTFLRENPHRLMLRLLGEAWLRPLVLHLRAVASTISESDWRRYAAVVNGLPQEVQIEGRASADRIGAARADLIAGIIVSASSTDPTATYRDSEHRAVLLEKADSAGPAVDADMSGATNRNGDSSRPVQDVDTHAIGDSVFVDDAGLVLLLPFIPMLFNQLNLLEEDRFRSDLCRSKAIRLLEFVAWGTTKRAEFVLRFQKLLCAQAAGQPLQGVELQQQETDEADSVLDAVCKHWTPLQNTSRDGLRNTFLQRRGLIKAHDDGGIVIVERQTVDVLLSKIPWSYSVVRLPWMDAPLTVQWA